MCLVVVGKQRRFLFNFFKSQIFIWNKFRQIFFPLEICRCCCLLIYATICFTCLPSERYVVMQYGLYTSQFFNLDIHKLVKHEINFLVTVFNLKELKLGYAKFLYLNFYFTSGMWMKFRHKNEFKIKNTSFSIINYVL